MVRAPPSRRRRAASRALTVCPPYSGSSTVSPTLTCMGSFAPSRDTAPGPTATTTPSFSFLPVSGKKMPPAVCEQARRGVGARSRRVAR